MQQLKDLGYHKVDTKHYERAVQTDSGKTKYILDINIGLTCTFTLTLFGHYKSLFVNHTVKTTYAKVNDVKVVISELEDLVTKLMYLQLKVEGVSDV